MNADGQILYAEKVLISTYWNVNQICLLLLLEVLSFNLNLLECKSGSTSIGVNNDVCFNLNLLECKCLRRL